MSSAQAPSLDARGPGALALRATLLLFLLAGVLGALELSSRVLDPGFLARAIGLHVYSTLRGWALRAGATSVQGGFEVSVNADGYRGPQVPRDDARGPIVVLGDSIGFGYSVPDGTPFAWQLDGRVDSRRVANLSVPGYGTDQEWLLLQEEGLAFHPALVLLSFSRGSDYFDTVSPVYLFDGRTPKPYCSLEGESLVLHPLELSWVQRFKRWVSDYSHLYNRAQPWRSSGGVEADLAEQPVMDWRTRYRGLVTNKNEAERVCLTVVRRIADCAREQGAIPVVAVFPDRRSFERPAGPRMSAFRARLDPEIRLVDMAEHFHERGLAYDEFAVDGLGHLGEAGHAIAAEILERELRDALAQHAPAK